jgi:hypothetical protein
LEVLDWDLGMKVHLLWDRDKVAPHTRSAWWSEMLTLWPGSKRWGKGCPQWSTLLLQAPCSHRFQHPGTKPLTLGWTFRGHSRSEV